MKLNITKGEEREEVRRGGEVSRIEIARIGGRGFFTRIAGGKRG